jgi:hypothetical protein
VIAAGFNVERQSGASAWSIEARIEFRSLLKFLQRLFFVSLSLQR